MSSLPKRVKSAEDQLGELPDDILCHILSFLSSKKAARTCVLSRRWRHLFLRVPKLIAKGQEIESNVEMLRFVDRWIMSSKEVLVDEFRLKSTCFPEAPVFDLWLTTLLSRGIRVLNLEFEDLWYPPTELLNPHEGFFRSETLVDVSICGVLFLLKIPDVVCYSSLKTLHLEDLKLVDESGHFRFLDASYPRLEEFSLIRVKFLLGEKDDAHSEGVERMLTISLATLKKLDVKYINSMGMIHIKTEHLEIFQFRNPDMEVDFSRCESLVLHADIHQFSPGASYLEILRQISNVKTLRLSLAYPQDAIAGSFPQLIHLTHLELEKTDHHQSVWIVLHHAPNLEVLDFDLYSEYGDFLPPEVVPLCLAQSLKEIRITSFKSYEIYMDDDEIGDVDELGRHTEIVEYFLQHGAVLERMSIGHPVRTASWRQSTLNLFQNLDRLSQNCVIDLEEEDF